MAVAESMLEHADFLAYALSGAVAVIQFFGYRELKRIDEQFKKGSSRMDKICNELCGGDGITGLKTRFAVLENEHHQRHMGQPLPEFAHHRDHEVQPHRHRRHEDETE